MPVTKSAKRALRVADRRHEENLKTKAMYKNAMKAVRKAVESGAIAAMGELLSSAQSALDTAAKNKTIHRNKAARLKSRMAKKLAAGGVAVETKPKATKKATAKPAAKKAPAKKAAAKKAK